jgi:hypothetical protein
MGGMQSGWSGVRAPAVPPVPGKRRQAFCRICEKRPPWRYRNCPPDVCKRCYHAHVWPERPATRRPGPTAEPTGGEDPDDG